MNEPAKLSRDWCSNYTRWKKSSTQLLRIIETPMQMKEYHTGIVMARLSHYYSYMKGFHFESFKGLQAHKLNEKQKPSQLLCIW